MSDTEKLEYARDAARLSYEKGESAESHGTEVANEFIRLEVQVATILFAITSFFAASFSSGGPLDIFWVKIMFVIGVFSLILSLLMGLLHLKRAESFWDDVLHQRAVRFQEWTKVVHKKVSFEEGDAFHRGTSLGKGITISVPSWIWVMQSIFLGVGITVLFVLFVASLFAHPKNANISIPVVVSITTPSSASVLR